MEKHDAKAVVLFRNTQTAIQAERRLQAQGIEGKLIPVPRQFGTECGLAFRFSRHDTPRVKALLEREGICYRGIHEL